VKALLLLGLACSYSCSYLCSYFRSGSCSASSRSVLLGPLRAAPATLACSRSDPILLPRAATPAPTTTQALRIGYVRRPLHRSPRNFSVVWNFEFGRELEAPACVMLSYKITFAKSGARRCSINCLDQALQLRENPFGVLITVWALMLLITLKLAALCTSCLVKHGDWTSTFSHFLALYVSSLILWKFEIDVAIRS